MKKIATLLLILPFFALKAENIFDKMDDKDAVSTGIYKLSDDEKEALAKWLKHSEKEIIKKERQRNVGFDPSTRERDAIYSYVEGEFNGWQGDEVFKLGNGQTWKQMDNGTTFYIPKRTNAEVVIKPKSMGAWYLYVAGYNKGVRVKRIE